MTEIIDWRDDLQAEEDLFAAYKVARAIKAPPFNRWVRITVGAISAIAIGITAISLGRESNTFFIDLIKYLSNSIFVASITIAAFLVTGFSVFVTLSDEPLLIALASIPHKDSNISIFKHLFYNFLRVFLVYIVAIAASVLIGFLVTITWDARLTVPDTLITLLNGVCLWGLIQLTVELILLLKSFVWNVYATFVSKLLAADEIRRHEAATKREAESHSQSGAPLARAKAEPATTH